MLQFELVTLSGIKFQGEAHEVVLPTADGYIAVFTHHAPLVSLATPGVIKIRHKAGDSDERMQLYAANGGVIEIANNTVRVLVDEADRDDEINEAEAQKAYDEAKQLAAQAKDSLSLQQAQALIDRQAVRLQVAGLRRHKRR